MFWKEALVLTLADTYVRGVDGRREECKAVTLDVGLDSADPSITFDGVKCGANKAIIFILQYPTTVSYLIFFLFLYH